MNENIKIFIKKRELYFIGVNALLVVGSFWIGYGFAGSNKGIMAHSDDSGAAQEVSGGIYSTQNASGTAPNGQERQFDSSITSNIHNNGATNNDNEVINPANITNTTDNQSTSKSNSGSAQTRFVASKTGTKYYPESCGSIERIKPENRVYFDSADKAVDAGYELSSQC
jgi:hypothetical protein